MHSGVHDAVCQLGVKVLYAQMCPKCRFWIGAKVLYAQRRPRRHFPVGAKVLFAQWCQQCRFSLGANPLFTAASMTPFSSVHSSLHEADFQLVLQYNHPWL